MKSNSKKLRVAVLGASGYTGAELIRLLSCHQKVDLTSLTSERYAGKDIGQVFPHLGRLGLPTLCKIEEVNWEKTDIDVVFCALPHGTTQDVISGLLVPEEKWSENGCHYLRYKNNNFIRGEGIKIIDLSADFRLANFDVYEKWYGQPHRAQRLQHVALYGLTELCRDKLLISNLIACPGCYPTASLLPLIPLIDAKIITSDNIVIDAKSGVSGAGRSLNEAMLFSEVAEGIHPYGIASHRHAPEIEQELSRAAGQPVILTFTPHLVPMNRGILATIYLTLEKGNSAKDARQILKNQYKQDPFVHVMEEGVVPATRHVRGSNHCFIGVFSDRSAGRVIIVSAIDNLVKGGSGQAVQNMNISCGFSETEGLKQVTMFP